MTLLIVPGLNGSGPQHWKTHWHQKIADAERVEQASWDAPDLDTWLDVLARQVRGHRGVILVGHSLGATLIAHLSARYPALPVGGALLIAPVDPERCDAAVPGIASFGPLPQLPLNFPSILVASRNDPYIAFDRARILANLWEAAFVDAGAAGHINVASGHGAWPAGLLLVDQLRGAYAAARPVARARVRSRATA